MTLLSSTANNQEFIFLETRDAFGYVEIYVNDLNSAPVKFHPNHQQEKREEVFKELNLEEYNANVFVAQSNEVLSSDIKDIKKLCDKYETESSKFTIGTHDLISSNTASNDYKIMREIIASKHELISNIKQLKCKIKDSSSHLENQFVALDNIISQISKKNNPELIKVINAKVVEMSQKIEHNFDAIMDLQNDIENISESATDQCETNILGSVNADDSY